MTVLHLHLEKLHRCQSHGAEAIVFLYSCFIAHFKDFYFGGGLLVVPSLKVIE